MTLMSALSVPTPVEVNFSAQAGRATPLLSLPLLDQPQAARQLRIQSYPLHGCLSLEADGRLLYVAKAGYVGPDRFSCSAGDTNSHDHAHYMVNVHVEHSSLVATAARWAYFALRNDSILVLPEAAMLRARPDAAIEGLSVVSVEQPHHGLVSRRADGCYSYTPEPGYVGQDSFDYLVVDAKLSRALVMIKLDLSAPTAAPTIELVPAQQAEVCDRLLSSTAANALQPSLRGVAAPGSEVTVVLDGRAVARVTADSQGRWTYSSSQISLNGASQLQAYVHAPDGCAVATARLAGKAALVEAFGASGSGHWASCTSRTLYSGYHGKGVQGPGGYSRGGLPAWSDNLWLGPHGRSSR